MMPLATLSRTAMGLISSLFYLQVFDVSMNGDLTVIPALDIFGRVGRGVAHDEYVPFTIAGNTLIVGGQETTLRGSKLRVDFVKVCSQRIVC